ncbi:hypothetical protein [Amycolatopsis anabasis]|uniref:hypothetical protein n=1 Tax=Amycolatopsis anabasis TaxID=1840409 RepID=UPI00131B7115|nr:hypothetical protein [Amycolatopsis anabasis]
MTIYHPGLEEAAKALYRTRNTAPGNWDHQPPHVQDPVRREATSTVHGYLLWLSRQSDSGPRPDPGMAATPAGRDPVREGFARITQPIYR